MISTEWHTCKLPLFPSLPRAPLSRRFSLDPCSLLKGLLDDIRGHIGCLYRLSECIAMLDMLHSFTHSVTISDYGKSACSDYVMLASIITAGTQTRTLFLVGECPIYIVPPPLVCPEFSPDTLCIKAGRHPMLDKMIYNQPVPNNVVRWLTFITSDLIDLPSSHFLQYASSSCNLTIITGPNMVWH